MSGPGQRPGQQDWIWSDGLQDHYRRHPNTGQYYMWNRGNPIPVPTTATQEPRSERQISRSHVLDVSQPSRAGSPPDEATANFLHRGYPQAQQIPVSRSSSQSGGPTSTHSTSPPSSTFIASRSNTIRRSDTSQTSRQAQGVRDSNTYSPQAPSFVPRAPSSGGIQSRLDQGISQLSIRPDDVRSGSMVSGSAQSAEYVNEESGVRSIVRSGNVITDQSLRQDNITIHKHLSGTDGQKEVLYPEFRRRSKPRNFFTVGKVFMILWAEPAGDSAKSNTLITSQQQSTYPGRFGELVFSKVRRFIVIRESDGYCSALSIVSYGSQGAGKSGVIKHEHGIVYTGRQVPQPTPDELPRRGEGAMVPTAVRVDPDQPTEKLTPMSRINYGKVYTVEHNVKVKPLGTVSRDSLHALIYQFKAVWNPGLPRQRGMASIPEAESSRVQQGASASGQGNYRAAYDSLTSQGWTPAQAEAVLKQKGKAHATSGSAGRSTSEEEQASSDENKEEAGAESHSDAQMRRAVRHLQRASGLSLEEATAVVRRERRKSLIKARAQSKDDRDDESDGEGSDSENEQQKAARNKQLAEARTRQFHNAVAALHQQGVSYEEAYRSVHASMTRGRSQTATSASQSGSTGRRRSERDDQDEEESDEESSGGGEDEDA